MKYNVLSPNYIKTVEKLSDGRPVFRVEWNKLGTATSMAEAKQLHPFPVLEAA